MDKYWFIVYTDIAYGYSLLVALYKHPLTAEEITTYENFSKVVNMEESAITLLLIILFSFTFYKWFTLFFTQDFPPHFLWLVIGGYTLLCVGSRLLINSLFYHTVGIRTSAVSSAVEIIFDMIYIIFLFQGAFYKKVFLYVITTMLLPTAESALLGLINQRLGLTQNLNVHNNNSYINFFTIQIISYLLILLIEEHQRMQRYQTENHFFIIIFSIVLFQFGMHYYLSYIATLNEYKKGFYTYQLVDALSIAIFFCICLVYEKSINVMQQTIRLNQKLDYYEYQSALYNDSIRNLKKIRKIRHDFKNHLITIRNLLDSNDTSQVRAYISELLDSIQSMNYIIDDQNPVVSALLTYKRNVCEQQQITFRYSLEYHQIMIEPTDLTILLGNILDNAIEACQQVPNPDHRVIRFGMKSHKNQIIIVCKNTFLPTITNASDSCPHFLHTTKADSQNHGFGIENITDVVHKYHGDVFFTKENDVFTATLYLNASQNQGSL